MLAKGESPLSEKTKTACCVACTLAEAMKDCSSCPFRVGLVVRTVHLETLRLADPVAKEAFWAGLPAEIWQAYWQYVNKSISS